MGFPHPVSRLPSFYKLPNSAFYRFSKIYCPVFIGLGIDEYRPSRANIHMFDRQIRCLCIPASGICQEHSHCLIPEIQVIAAFTPKFPILKLSVYNFFNFFKGKDDNVRLVLLI